MAGPSKFILGLGNPGPRYDATRHNVGFVVADHIVDRIGNDQWQPAAASLFVEGRWKGRPFVIAKPQTFVNRSGQAFQALRRRYGLDPADGLVVYDDIALPLGQIRLRPKGGAGGHNGVQDIIDHLDSDEFPRLRIGVGDSFPRGKQVDYVLSPFDDEELETLGGVIERSVDASLTFVKEGIQASMNRFN